ncbi:MAG TPA: AMP-binding protein [Dehalococcoidia bacterium]|nr:AMP-binding protein [Dehalococcoidia bacterium]
MNGSLPEALFAQARSRPNAVALRWKRRGIWHERSWAQYAAQVQRLAAGLRRAGLAPAKAVLVQGANSVERLQAELAVIAAGSVALCLDAEASEADFAALCAARRPDAIVADTAAQAGAARRLGGTPPAAAWLLRGAAAGLPDVAALGGSAAESAESGISAPANGGEPALILLTTGSSASPRPVTLSHAALLGAAERLSTATRAGERDILYSFLPAGWIGDRTLATALHPLAGGVLGFPEDQSTALADLQECGPTLLLAPPRLWQILALALRGRAGTRGLRASLVRRALGGNGSTLARGLVARPLRDQAGLLHTRLALCAGGPLDARTSGFFRALGMPLRDLYLLTEAGGAVAIAGAAGALRLLDGIHAAARGGEIVLALPEGELATGDAGRLDGAALTLGGRLASRLDLPTGEQVSTAPLEQALASNTFVRHALLAAGDGRGLSALIELEDAAVAAWSDARRAGLAGHAEYVRSPAVHELLAQAVAEANASVLEGPRIGAFEVLDPPLDAGAGELTRLRTVRAPLARERRAAALAELSHDDPARRRRKDEARLVSADS